MSYWKNLLNSRKWYVSHEIFAIEVNSEDATGAIDIMENLILICAENPQEAYEKALHHGSRGESDVRVDDKPGRIVFKGLKQLSLIYDELVDGAELEWYEYEMGNGELERILKSKDELHAFNLQPKEN